ncbi:unnamed protein product [Larinioides sclopetarius]|uniref:Neurotransmitter-gated ion-channel ligand-binding domain-containing protein n=1 Tax=Larinioides sclopetarius TaxID=280406 RepID=A0AAV1ZLN9_9ARAC
MYFKDYPFDTQLCEFPIKLMDSHFYNVTLEWLMENETQSLYFTEEFKPLKFFFKRPAALIKNGNIFDTINITFLKNQTCNLLGFRLF